MVSGQKHEDKQTSLNISVSVDASDLRMLFRRYCLKDCDQAMYL